MDLAKLIRRQFNRPTPVRHYIWKICVVEKRRNYYLRADGSWGRVDEAKPFRSRDAAVAYAASIDAGTFCLSEAA